MAEIVGVIASILTLAGSSLTVSRWILDISTTLRAAGQELKEFSDHIGSFSAVMETAHFYLQKYCVERNDSKLLQERPVRKAFRVIARHCKRVIRKIREMLPDLRAIPSSLSLVSRIRWYMQAASVKAVRQDMDSMKMNLCLLMNCVALEVSCKEGYSTEMISLLRVQLQETMIQAHSLSKQRNNSYPQDDRIERMGRSIDKVARAQAVIIKLVSGELDKPMVHRRAQPDGPARHLDTNNEAVVQPIPGRQGPHLPTAQHRAFVRPNSSASSPLQQEVRSSLPVVPENSSLRHSEDSTSSSRDDEKSFIYVDRQEPLQDIRNIMYPQIIAGRINGREAMAQLDATFGCNIISQNYAAELGLSFGKLEEEHEGIVLVHSDGSQETPIGMTKFPWSERRIPRSIPITVHCFITQHNIRQKLILGKTFNEKSKQALNRGKRVDGFRMEMGE